MSDITREQAREQIARELYVVAHAGILAGPSADDTLRSRWAKSAHGDCLADRHWAGADAALSVLWPEIERLRGDA